MTPFDGLMKSGCERSCLHDALLFSYFLLIVVAVQDTRERAHRAIKDRMDAAITSRAKADDKFQSFVATEIAEIKNAIRTETEARMLMHYLHMCCFICNCCCTGA